MNREQWNNLTLLLHRERRLSGNGYCLEHPYEPILAQECSRCGRLLMYCAQCHPDKSVFQCNDRCEAKP